MRVTKNPLKRCGIPPYYEKPLIEINILCIVIDDSISYWNATHEFETRSFKKQTFFSLQVCLKHRRFSKIAQFVNSITTSLEYNALFTHELFKVSHAAL